MLAETFAVICLAAIDDKTERKNVAEAFKGRRASKVIDITEAQVARFAGNLLQVQGTNERTIFSHE